MSFFTLKDLVEWLGLTAFELFLNTFGVLLTTVLFVIHQEELLTMTSWQVFSPLLICDALNMYFCIIVFIRQCREKAYRNAILRLVSSLSFLVCCFVCKFLLCQQWGGEKDWSYGEVFAPVFVALQVMMVRASQVH